MREKPYKISVLPPSSSPFSQSSSSNMHQRWSAVAARGHPNPVDRACSPRHEVTATRRWNLIDDACACCRELATIAPCNLAASPRGHHRPLLCWGRRLRTPRHEVSAAVPPHHVVLTVVLPSLAHVPHVARDVAAPPPLCSRKRCTARRSAARSSPPRGTVASLLLMPSLPLRVAHEWNGWRNKIWAKKSFYINSHQSSENNILMALVSYNKLPHF